MDRRLAEAVAAGVDLQEGFDDADARSGQLGHLMRAARYRSAVRAAADARGAAQQLGAMKDGIARSLDVNDRLMGGLNDLTSALGCDANGETT